MSEAETLDRATLEAIKYDTAYDRAGYIARLWDEMQALDLSDDAELADARDMLMGWDFTADSVGRADALALLMIREWSTCAISITLPNSIDWRSSTSSRCTRISSRASQ